MLSEAIKHTYLLQGLSEEQIDIVASLAFVREYPGGEVIVRQYAKGADVCIVLDGAVRVSGFSGETYAEYGPGSVIGEVALVDNGPRSANVVSVGFTRIAVISAEALWKLMYQDATIAREILTNLSRILCMRLRSANVQLDLTQSRLAASVE